LILKDIISKNIIDDNVKESLLSFIEWLRVNKIKPLYTPCDGQSPFWELNYDGKKHFIVWNEKNDIYIMLNLIFSDEFQEKLIDINTQSIIFENLQECSRKNGESCDNCNLPSDEAGVERIIFGKRIKNLCYGEYISFSNPDTKTIEVIKELIQL